MLPDETGLRPRDECAHLIRLKAELLTSVVCLSPRTLHRLKEKKFKLPRPVRSGMSSGLEFRLLSPGDNETAISCRYRIGTAEADEFELRESPRGVELYHPEGGPYPVKLLPRPTYYDLFTSSGKSMAGIAQQSFTKLAVGVYGRCCFNSKPEHACHFCAIHSVGATDSQSKSDQDILETVRAAAQSELDRTIETVMLGGGAPACADRGARRFSCLAEQVRKIIPDWEISVMMVPPDSDRELERMRDSGVGYVSINMEFGGEKAFSTYTPGKAGLIGKQRYKDCLKAAVNIFGRNNVQSLLVTGLPDEPMEETLQAVEWLSSHGVIPVLSPYRPLPDTVIQDAPAPSVDEVVELYGRARQIARKYGMFLGPKCTPCQCNTMALHWDRPINP